MLTHALRPPDPPEQHLSPETATVNAGSVRLQGGLRCPSCLFCPCWWGAWPPPEGNLRLRGRERIAHVAPSGCGCGKSVPGAGLSQDAAGDASGAKSRRVETGPTLALNVLTAASWAFLPPLPLPSSPAPGHDPAGLSVSRNTWPFPELRRLNSCSPAPPANSSCPKCLALYRTAPLPLAEPALQPLV